MNASLDMKLQIISVIAVYLPLVNYDANLLGQPARDSPKLFCLWAVDCCIEHENSGSTVYSLPGCKRLVALTPAAPSSTCGLTLDACLENLTERRLRSARISRQRFLDRSVQGYNLLRNNILALDKQGHEQRMFQVGYAHYDNSCIEWPWLQGSQEPYTISKEPETGKWVIHLIKCS